MTRSIYLSSISINNFRPFLRCNVNVPSPGVLILAGPNGLGKSSFFDAIEWGLTGNVKRLSGTEHSPGERLYARRRRDGSLSETFDVCLRFSQEGEIRRSAEISTVSGQLDSSVSPEHIAPLLRAKNWSLEITDPALSSYLHQTHFFLQSSLERFVYRDPLERWNDFEGPAGVKKMMAIQRGLGKNTKSALTKRGTQLERDAELAKAQLKKWLELLAKREFLKSQLTDGGGLSPSQASEGLSDLEASLRLPVLERPTGTRLQRVFQHLQTEELNLSRYKGLIDEAKEIVVAFGETQGALAEIEQQQARRQQYLDETTERIKSLCAARSSRQLAIDAIRIAQREQEQRFEQLTAVRNAKTLEHELSSSIVSAQEQSLLIRTQLAETRRQSALQNEEISRIKFNRKQRSDTQQRLREISSIDQTASRILEKIVESADLIRERRELTADLSNVESELAKEREDLLTQEEAIESVRDELALESQRRDAIKSAISTIVANIAADQGTCPLCRGSYTHDELHERMEEALRGGGEELIRLEKKISEEEDEANTIREFIQIHTHRIRTIKLRLAELTKKIDDIDRTRGELLSSPLLVELGVRDINLVRARLATSRDTAQDLLRRLPATEVENTRLQEIEALLNGTTERERSLETKDALATQELSRLETRKLSADSVIRNNNDIATVIELRSSEAFTEVISSLERARSEHQSLVKLNEDLAKSIDSEEKIVSDIRVQLAEFSQRLAELRNRLASMTDRWRHVAVVQGPSAEGVSDLETQYRIRNDLLNVSRMKHKQIADGIAKWTAETQLNETEMEIEAHRSKLENATLDDVTRRLQEDVNYEQEQVAINRTVIHGVGWLDRKVKDSMDSYVPNLLDPLNQVAGRVFEALSIFPGQQVQMQAPRRNSEYPVSLQVRGDFTGDVARISPEDMLSEGQLSFVSLGIMISMSLVYRWSDWRCLLLDDPFQNNDIIHISALLDLLRGLSVDRGYQIVMSTHDYSLADYLRRKFLAGGVSTSVCRLASSTDEGVIVEQ